MFLTVLLTLKFKAVGDSSFYTAKIIGPLRLTGAADKY